MIEDLYKEFKVKVGDKRAKQFIASLIECAVLECSDDNVAKAIHDAIASDYNAFVLKKVA
jgi:hypothetical protein